jgi:ferredoxin
MLVLYFSGTGNTRFIATTFSQEMDASCHSIEENIDFQAAISQQDKICFCYPIYGSCVPVIMQDFVAAHRRTLQGKSLIIFCTQNVYSGDGARVFTDLLKGLEYQVIYAAHFNMPNNLINLSGYPKAGPERVKKYKSDAELAVERVCIDLRQGKIRRKGFNPFSQFLGFMTQRIYFRRTLSSAQNSVRIRQSCILCQKCVKACPAKNLVVENGKLIHKGQCFLCQRCVNLCPQKAISVLHHSEIKEQYKGL